MKRIITLVIACGVLSASQAPGGTLPDPGLEQATRKRLVSRDWTRLVESFNQGWLFALADQTTTETANAIGDGRWRRVDLPHDWGVEHPVHAGYLSAASGGYTKAGLGWYRKTFSVPDDWRDRRVYIDFGGVFMNSEVWINGEWLGLRPYGFASFRYDLTPFLKFDESNEIIVRVDNILQRSARWYTGSGIYRDVKLVVADPAHVDHWGTHILTPQVSEKQATVILKTIVSNTLDASRDITIRTTLAGQKLESTENVPGLGKVECFQTLKISPSSTVRPLNF